MLEPLRNAGDRQLHRQVEILLESIKRYEEQISQFQSANGVTATGIPSLRRRDETLTAGNSENEQQPMSQSDYLREALRPLEAGEKRIQGLFVKLECDNKGVAYFSIQAVDRVYKLRATSLGRVQFTAYVSAPAEVTCGPRKNPENVVLTYRPTSDPKDARAKIDGDAIAVELVPKDFQFKN